MSKMSETTTLVSLFHTEEHAGQALSDLQAAGIPQQSIQTVGGSNAASGQQQTFATLQALNLPAKDLQILSDGLKNGAKVIIVRAEEGYADKAEAIFKRHDAGKIDERTLGTDAASAASVTGDGVIPVIEEELVVGKRTVARGGVRLISRVVETPVEEQVTLREEHARVERVPVNRPISVADVDKLQDQSIQVEEIAEEAVVGKRARVVEEISLRKETTEHTQQVKDSVRKTEVEVEQIAEDLAATPKPRK